VRFALAGNSFLMTADASIMAVLDVIMASIKVEILATVPQAVHIQLQRPVQPSPGNKRKRQNAICGVRFLRKFKNASRPSPLNMVNPFSVVLDFA
jgi:hypothetical protein